MKEIDDHILAALHQAFAWGPLWSHMPAESRRKLEEMVKGAALPTDLSSLSDGESTTLLHATHIGLSLIAGLRIAVHAPAVTVN